MIGRIARCSVFATLLAVVATAPAMAQTEWSLGTSSTGSGPYVNGVIIANQVNAAQGVVAVSAQTSGGYNENLALVAGQRINVGMTNLLDLDAAYEGTGKFETVKGKEVFTNLRALFIHAGSVVHFLTRADSVIRKFEDIRGRMINLNTPS
ncbi:MAG: TAXI family TRAP transporter solute-binding subunit, partial [Alphaproteobacteria bacterium]